MNGKTAPEVTPEIAPEVSPTAVDMGQVKELHAFATKALDTLQRQKEEVQKQLEEISAQVDRQIGLVSGLEILLGGNVEDTLKQVREMMKKGQEKTSGA